MNTVSPKNTTGPESPARVSKARSARPNDVTTVPSRIILFIPTRTENRPDPTDIYQVTQNAGYDFTDLDRERINGQLVLQVKPTDTLSLLVDYTYSQNTINARTSSIGVWFNHDQTSSSWTSSWPVHTGMPGMS